MKKPSLLSPEFLERLRSLRDLVFRVRRKGEIQSRGSGQSPEFGSHRPYEPGDDPRYIDWNIYARLEKLLLKLYVLDDETQIGILLDTSRSMREPGRRKLDMAARMAASYAYLAVSGGHEVRLGAWADRLLAAIGPYRSSEQFQQCLHFLSSPPEGTGTDLGRSVAEFTARRREGSVLVIISDFLQERDVVADLEWMLGRKDELHLVQVLEEDELHPALRGEFTVSDLEGGEALNLSIGDDLLTAFHKAIRDRNEDLAETCRRRGIPFLSARAHLEFDKLLLGHLTRGEAGGAS